MKISKLPPHKSGPDDFVRLFIVNALGFKQLRDSTQRSIRLQLQLRDYSIPVMLVPVHFISGVLQILGDG